MEKFLKVNVKLPAPVETGALISAIQFFRYEDRLSGKKKLQSHNLAQKAAASLLASQPKSQSRAVLLPKCFTNPGVLGVCCRSLRDTFKETFCEEDPPVGPTLSLSKAARRCNCRNDEKNSGGSAARARVCVFSALGMSGLRLISESLLRCQSHEAHSKQPARLTTIGSAPVWRATYWFWCVAERLDPWCSGLPLQEVNDVSETSHQGAR